MKPIQNSLGISKMTKPILTKDAKPASDIDAHTTRIDAYANYAAREINSIFDEELADFPNDKEISILDVGCGNGKQSPCCLKIKGNRRFIFDASQKR